MKGKVCVMADDQQGAMGPLERRRSLWALLDGVAAGQGERFAVMDAGERGRLIQQAVESHDAPMQMWLRLAMLERVAALGHAWERVHDEVCAVAGAAWSRWEPHADQEPDARPGP